MGLTWNWGRRTGLSLLVVLACAGQSPRPASSAPTAEEINTILKELSDVTGFHVRKPLPFAVVTRDEVNRYLKEQIRHSVKPDEIRAEETTLKKFGFVPPDFDLRQTTIDLLTEQAAAFYDFRRKKLFISDWATVNMRDAALIHELAHALADQNFPIQKFVSKGSDNSETSMAREAVVEGQASWLMIEVDARRSGKTLADPVLARELLSSSADSGDSEYPVFSKAPLYLRKTLIFPYVDGQRFQEAVYLKEGKSAFARLFRQPPVSTAQIQHPERYFNGESPSNPRLPDPAEHARPFVTGSLGELETRILLEQYIGAEIAEELGPLLRGAAYRVDEGKKDRRATLTFASEWRDNDAAARFFGAYQRVLQGKWKSVEVDKKTDEQFEGKSEDGFFKVTRDGTRILSEEGFAHPPG